MRPLSTFIRFLARNPILQMGLLGILWVLGTGTTAQATHIRAGEIRAERVSNASLSYRFFLTVYTDTSSPIDVPEATLFFGDGTSQKVERDPADRIPIVGAGTVKSVFRFNHTYASNRTYTVYYWEANRNDNVLNMNNSVQTTFYVEAQIIIDPNIPPNSSPILTVPPVDLGQFGAIYIHNPGAYDPDGDSLSWELIPCRQWDEDRGVSREVDNFRSPVIVSGGTNAADNGPATIRMTSRGDFIWDCPNLIGEYNIAIKITEWRKVRGRRVPIGYVVRDMQIIIRDGRNKPPQIRINEDTCIVAGAVLRDTVVASDPDAGDLVVMNAYGYPMELSPARRASFTPINAQSPPVRGFLRWQTSCLDVRQQPIDIVYRVEDVPRVKFKLSDTKTWRIKIFGPKPTGLALTARLSGMALTWDNYKATICPNADRIQVWRRVDSSFAKPSACEGGIPKGEPYRLIANLPADASSFVDEQNGGQLPLGVRYCYRLVATFPEPQGGVSYASEEVCGLLKLTAPVIMEASTLKTHQDSGRVQVRWSRPLDLNDALWAPPYQYLLYRSDTLTGAVTEIYRTDQMTDTSYLDTGLNTVSNLYRYSVRLGVAISPVVPPDTSAWAQEIAPRAFGQDNSIAIQFEANVPWTNSGRQAYVYRRTRGAASFDLIDSVICEQTATVYQDAGQFGGVPLVKGQVYEYYVITQGSYGDPRLRRPLINFSRIVSGQLLDTTKPCTPVLTLVSPACPSCESLSSYMAIASNELSWTLPDEGCDSSIVGYKLYFKPDLQSNYTTLASLKEKSFTHFRAGDVAGCYYVTAVSSSGIESRPSNILCQDNCDIINLPNVFTPGIDSYNPVFRFYCTLQNFISNGQVQILNRWGNLVYEGLLGAESVWDGRSRNSGRVEAGVFYYDIKLQYRRLDRNQSQRQIKGWVQVLPDN